MLPRSDTMDVQILAIACMRPGVAHTEWKVVMPTIGLLHGMSSVATGDYYRRINDGVNVRLGGHERPQLLLWSVNFGDIERFVHDGAWNEAGAYLAERAQRLQAAGADFLMCGSNTMHQVAPAIEAATTVPFVHIVDVLADAAELIGARTLGLLGTRATMESDAYRERLAERGLRLLVPDEQERALIDQITFEELTQNVFTDSSRNVFMAATFALVARGADVVVLGCTEFGLLMHEDDVPGIPLLDTTALHVQRAIELAIGARPLPVR